jgi:hypothetical protein
VKKICCHTFLCSHKFHIIEHYFSFEVLKKKIWANFQRIIELLPKKFSLSSQKYECGIRYPGSGKKPIPDPGSRGQKGTGSRIRIRNTDDRALSVREFIGEWELRLARAVHAGCHYSDAVLAFKLLERANLEKAELELGKNQWSLT